MKKVLAFYGRVSYNKQCQGNKTADGVWRSLVARSAGGREVAGSNPVAPIKSTFAKSRCALLLDIYTMMIPAKERETNERKKQF